MTPTHIGGPVYEWQFARSGTPLGNVVDVRAPDGTSLQLNAFADGDIWRARLSAIPAGVWQWSAQTGDRGTLHVPDSSSWTGPLKVSADRHHLVRQDETPWFWLADTAWSIVFKGTPDEWATYLDRRITQGFNVLQVTLLPWRWEFTDCDGNRPFVEGDPERPNPRYFERYDRFLRMAGERGLVVCLMLIWGGPRPLLPAIHFSTDQAVAFARYAVARFAAFPTVWSISGDAEYVRELDKWDAVGEAVEAADAYRRPTTNHLQPTMNWVGVHAEAAWHDFHMIQTGHRQAARADIADLPVGYAKKHPPKPFLNGEPWYEAHPARDTTEYGPLFTAFDARYAFWVSILSGAGVGHTYGSQGIWNWKHPGDSEEEVAGPQIGPLWTEALEHAGAEHCGLGARFLRTLEWWRLRPAPERVQIEPAPTIDHRPFCAVVEDELWLVYAPAASGRLRLKGVRPLDWTALWFDPRTGAEHTIGRVEVGLDQRWQAPPSPSAEDWLLVLRRV
ncbi:MAG: DUF4038 domain-containing protein [Chloroflexi bacterium]|nr:DUF4038 domain-containing protein [Chloroflexota bacterium]